MGARTGVGYRSSLLPSLTLLATVSALAPLAAATQLGGASISAGSAANPGGSLPPRVLRTKVVGVVVDAGGLPLAGASVVSASGASAVSKPGGAFALGNHPLFPDPLRVDVSIDVRFGWVAGVPLVPGGTTQVGAVVVDVDTDGDGLPDWHELNVYASDPDSTDTDGDGLEDGYEVLTTGTDPAQADTDGDGFDDGLELALGTDPLAFDPGTHVSGLVRLAGGGPAAGAQLTLAGLAAHYATMADGSGAYAFPTPWPVAAGPLTVRAQAVAAGEGHAGSSQPVPPALAGPTVVPTFELCRPTLPAPVVGLDHELARFVLADLDADGILDLVAGRYYQSGSFSVLLGQASGGFGPEEPYGYPDLLNHLMVADLDGDGLLDVAGASYQQLHLFLGQAGGGTFAAAGAYDAGEPLDEPFLEDLDGDGLADLVFLRRLSPYGVVWRLGTGSGSFGARQFHPLAGHPRSVARGDLDLDGLVDLVVTIDSLSATGGQGSGATLLQSAPGVFAAPAPFPASQPRGVALGDLNEDGRLDAVVAEDKDPGKVYVGLGNGVGGFGPIQKFDVGAHPLSVRIGDVDGDGHLDVVVGDAQGWSAARYVLAGTGGGGLLAPLALATPGAGASFELEDIDRDGHLDVLLASPHGLATLLGRGDGSFPPLEPYPLAGAGGIQGLELGDADADGIDDLIVLQSPSPPSGGLFLSVRPGLGAGVFGAEVSSPDLSDAEALDLGDLDGDGRLDLVIAGECGAAVLAGLGDLTFAPPVCIDPQGAAADWVAVGDLNVDGEPDVLTVRALSASTTVHLSQAGGGFAAPLVTPLGGASACSLLADLDGDGQLDLATHSEGLPEVWVARGNGDGTFAASQAFATGVGSPTGLAAGRLDPDGVLDLAIADGDGQVAILAGLGAAAFGAPASIPVAFTRPGSLELADMDLDGIQDLVLGGSHAYGFPDAGVAAVLKGNPDGTYTRASQRVFGSVRVRDVDADGVPDLVAGDDNGAVFVLRSALCQ